MGIYVPVETVTYSLPRVQRKKLDLAIFQSFYIKRADL